MGLFAAEGATQIFASAIARVGEEKNPAMPAPAQVGSQMRLGFKNRSQQLIILKHQTCYRALPIPAGIKLKTLRDPCCKKPKLSLKMLTIQ